MCLFLAGLPAPAGWKWGYLQAFDEVFTKTHVNTCGVKCPHQIISVAAELLQMSSGTRLSGKSAQLHSFRITLFSPNEAADKTGDKGLFNGVGGGLERKDLLV